MGALAAIVYALIGLVLVVIGAVVVPRFEAPIRNSALVILRICGSVFELLNGCIFLLVAYLVWSSSANTVWTSPLVLGGALVLLGCEVVALALATRLGQLRTMEPEAYSDLLERRIRELERELATNGK